jgi:hypothetical protein
MSDNKEQITPQEVAQFKIDRVKKLTEIYADEPAAKRRYDQTARYRSGTYNTAAEVRDALNQALTNKDTIVETSRQLYATNPIYASAINYLADMFMWRYKVTPHKVYTKSKAKSKKQPKADDFNQIYNLMLEAVDGINIPTKFPALLTMLFVNGAVYWTTLCDEDSISIDTILLPDKYCRKIGETQFGTAIIQFDMAYFDEMGLDDKELKAYFDSFPPEFKKAYNKYIKDNNLRWYTLDPHYSSGLMMNEIGIPTYFYLYGSILDYEKYQDNELERNENLLKYLVVHTMPHYEDKLIFEVDEVAALHKSLRRIVDTGEKARLITTYGDVSVHKISENDTSENEVLSKAFKTIFSNAGFNSGIFTSETVEGLKMSLIRDKGIVWKYVQSLLSFYCMTVNNWFDFKDYQADIDILPISTYTYIDDIKVYKENATLGIGKLDYIIASGIKQIDLQDQFYLEKFLKLDQITPMQTSYTQTAEDRQGEDNKTDEETSKESKNSKSGIEPSDKEEVDDKTKDDPASDVEKTN